MINYNPHHHGNSINSMYRSKDNIMGGSVTNPISPHVITNKNVIDGPHQRKEYIKSPEYQGNQNPIYT
jgi:hypothetical protein